MIIRPKCGSKHVIPVLYGMPTYEAFELAEQGKMIIAGCKIPADRLASDSACVDCYYRWSTASLPATKITKIQYQVTENGPCATNEQRTWKYEIFPDGKCIRFLYRGLQMDLEEQEETQVSKGRVYRLFCAIQKVVRASNCEKHIMEGIVCDGCRYELEINYADMRTDTIEGDVAGGAYDTILEAFVKGVFREEH